MPQQQYGGMPYGGMPQQQYGGYNRGGGKENNRGNRQMNPVRVFENPNYCHTHGWHVEDDHTSTTCLRPATNHNRMATRENPMGGSNAGRHKTIMPSQVGKQPNRRPQRPLGKQKQQQQYGGHMQQMMPPPGFQQQQQQFQQPKYNQQQWGQGYGYGM